MADFCDDARRAEELLLAEALARAGACVPAGESLTECEECGGPIPEARRAALPGVRLCVDCQTEKERGR